MGHPGPQRASTLLKPAETREMQETGLVSGLFRPDILRAHNDCASGHSLGGARRFWFLGGTKGLTRGYSLR